MTPHRIIVIGRNDKLPRFAGHLPRASLRGNLAPSVSAMLSEGASSPTYDATAGRWIVPPSGKTPDAGPAAELRHLDCNTLTRSNSPSQSPVSSPEDTGHLLYAGMEAFTVLAGFAVFGAIAWFFLVLA